MQEMHHRKNFQCLGDAEIRMDISPVFYEGTLTATKPFLNIHSKRFLETTIIIKNTIIISKKFVFSAKRSASTQCYKCDKLI